MAEILATPEIAEGIKALLSGIGLGFSVLGFGVAISFLIKSL